MGLSGQALDAIGREHAFRAITGDVLLIGRQTTYFTPSELMTRFREHGVVADQSAIEIDRATVNRGRSGEFVTDRSIFRALGNSRVLAVDVNPYEGAEIIHNLNDPIPDTFRGTADFIVDGSTLDNVFDPAMAIRNFAALLRPGGRMLTINAWNTREGSYTACSAAWYFDFFVANGFADCKVYMCVSAGSRSNVYWLDPDFMGSVEARVRPPIFACWWRKPFTLVLAEKAGSAQSAVVSPTQGHYRSDQEWSHYLENLQQIKKSQRPHLLRSIGCLLPRTRSPRSNGFVWIDDTYTPRLLPPKPLQPAMAAITSAVKFIRQKQRNVRS
jgi:hypothetical protein